jgi:hypothetical protein
MVETRKLQGKAMDEIVVQRSLRRRRHRGHEGAVLVEFLMAFFPLFLFFMALLQHSALTVGKLMTTHAAILGARAAVVVLPDDPGQYGGVPIDVAAGGRLDAIKQAVAQPLQIFDKGAAPEVRVDVTGAADNEPVVVNVAYDFPCTVPVGYVLSCQGRTKRLTAKASLPKQGMRYAY